MDTAAVYEHQVMINGMIGRKMMAENIDKDSKEDLVDFLDDMSNSLVPLKAYSLFLEEYLEALAQQENIPPVVFSKYPGSKGLHSEEALKIIGFIRAHAERLSELNNTMRHTIKLREEPHKWRDENEQNPQ